VPAIRSARLPAKRTARPLWFGHPWVYANAIDRLESDGEVAPGDAVSLTDHDGRLIGRGFYNPRSQIPVRLATRIDEPLNDAFLRGRVARALGLRRRLGLPSERTSIYRLINSEGDDLPGLVVDVYGAGVQITTLGMSERRRDLTPRGRAARRSELAPAAYADLEGFAAGSRVARGASTASVAVIENGVALEVEPLSGQKTGMFIDQRETRARVATLARGARVLDVYAYSGGFGLAAARAGAAAVTAVDSSARAVARIGAHAEKNGVTIEAVEADAFRYLETATPRSFDLVVIDPPKFARARKDLDAARKGYERLNALALQAVSAGGVLVTCSPQNVDAETFERIAPRARSTPTARSRSSSAAAPPSDPGPPSFTEPVPRAESLPRRCRRGLPILSLRGEREISGRCGLHAAGGPCSRRCSR
jgi:23S rRNA (cytosine1962-C5)-methyltransferase